VTILRKDGPQHAIYVHEKLGHLVAVDKAEIPKFKAYYKKYKGKKDPPKETVSGFPFVMDEEQESLKIDFEKPQQYVIAELTKFDG
jgi:hypothetical protein